MSPSPPSTPPSTPAWPIHDIWEESKTSPSLQLFTLQGSLSVFSNSIWAAPPPPQAVAGMRMGTGRDARGPTVWLGPLPPFPHRPPQEGGEPSPHLPDAPPPALATGWHCCGHQPGFLGGFMSRPPPPLATGVPSPQEAATLPPQGELSPPGPHRAGTPSRNSCAGNSGCPSLPGRPGISVPLLPGLQHQPPAGLSV